MSNCALPPTCGICICNPAMCAVGVSAATGGGVSNPVCGSLSCCGGMAAVTVTGGQVKSVLPWLLAGAAALYLFMRKR